MGVYSTKEITANGNFANSNQEYIFGQKTKNYIFIDTQGLEEKNEWFYQKSCYEKFG